MELIHSEYSIPTRARGHNFYKEVFPEVFSSSKSNRTLVIGSGMSNISLSPGVVAVDPGYQDLDSFFKETKHYAKSHIELQSAQETNSYAKKVAHRDDKNSHLVAGVAEHLPFPKNHFNNIVSANCIFGGMEMKYQPEYVAQTILNITEHLQANGKLFLYPYFSQSPKDVQKIELFALADAQKYILAYSGQQEVLFNLHKHNLTITATEIYDRQNSLPNIIQSLAIST